MKALTFTLKPFTYGWIPLFLTHSMIIILRVYVMYTSPRWTTFLLWNSSPPYCLLTIICGIFSSQSILYKLLLSVPPSLFMLNTSAPHLFWKDNYTNGETKKIITQVNLYFLANKERIKQKKTSQHNERYPFPFISTSTNFYPQSLPCSSSFARPYYAHTWLQMIKIIINSCPQTSLYFRTYRKSSISLPSFVVVQTFPSCSVSLCYLSIRLLVLNKLFPL